MEVLPWTLLLLAICAGGAQSEDDLWDASDLFDSLIEKTSVVVTAQESKTMKAETTALATDKKEEKETSIKPSLDALGVMEQLKRGEGGQKITPGLLFSFNTREALDKRAVMKVFGPWVDQVIAREFQERNPVRAYGLLVNVSSLLEISYAGCYKYECGEPVRKVTKDYQTFMYDATSISINGVTKTLRVMKFIKTAVQQASRRGSGQENAKILIKKTIPRIDEMISDYDHLYKSTVALKNKTDAIVEWTGKKKESINKIVNKWKDEEKNRSVETAKTKKQLELLRISYDDTMKKLTDIEKDRKELHVEFMRLVKTDSGTTQECDSKVLATYKTIVDEVKTSVEVKAGCGSFLGIGGCGKSGVHTDTNKNTKAIRLNDRIDRKCWTKKDEVAMLELTNKMEKINEKINATRPEYLLLLDRINEAQKQEQSMAGQLAGLIVASSQYKESSDELENAIRSIERVKSALALVYTIFKEAKAFWKHQKKFIEEYIKKPVGDASDVNNGVSPLSDDEEIAQLLGQKDNTVWRNRIITLGMNWIVYGRLASLGYTVLEQGKKEINRVYIREYDDKSRQELLDKGKQVIKIINDYLDKIKEANKISKEQRELAYDAILAGFNTTRPEVAPTAVVLTTLEPSGVSTDDPY